LRKPVAAKLIAHDDAVIDPLCAKLAAIKGAALNLLDAVDATVLALDVARLHTLERLRVDIGALDPAIGTGRANRMALAALDLDGAAGVAAAAVREGKGLALDARSGKAAGAAVAAVRKSERLALGTRSGEPAAVAFHGAHLEAATAATASDIGLDATAAATATAAYIGTDVAAAVRHRGRLAAAFSAAMLAGLGARGHRNRQCGDACG
jgi:hypothetical protein